MNVSLFYLVITNILSFCGGALGIFLFVFCCENRRFRNINNNLDASLNHQQIVYPPTSPVLASAPLPENPQFTTITLK